MSETSLIGRRALVTGAAGGIGAAIARSLREAGAEVAIADIDLAAAEATAAAIGAHALRMDVRHRAEVEAGFARAVEQMGGCDILIGNAGVSTMAHALDITDEEWDFNLDVNARGIFLTNQIAARHFVAEGQGCIVNTASVGGKGGAPFLAHYCASKFAVIGWTQSLALELASKGIRVNAVCPGYTRTSMQSRELIWEAELRAITPEEMMAQYATLAPLGRNGSPEDVAGVVTFLCSDQARFMTGQSLNVDGGLVMH
ncbi:SDR family NAD(P)-dependent oxidoreductase [Paracoccus aminophilus]|uniref:Short-chain dehydrogenase/reductase SDR n=1 Tax=Paracoccus aminophilus JCM 7686 TaxID=1367847 RepID=S5YZI0_PARAH|nr:SDR family NAD(P)-dependent oxidoreductase [Paracoccus aminophilus]AGT10616.1 short-chain dehydrogenase/reductase SDR [Paracoccus aminophilus JCM 7686]